MKKNHKKTLNLSNNLKIILKLVKAFLVFYILPFLIFFGLYLITYELFSCSATSFFPRTYVTPFLLPHCKIDIGNPILLFLTLLFWFYYIFPFPLVLPTILSVLFLWLDSKKTNKKSSSLKS